MAIKVDRSNFTVAETDHYFRNHLQEHPVNTIRHSRGFSTVESQVVIRENKDCLYSHAVVDVSEGAYLANPAWDRYSIIQVIDENQYSFAHLYPGESLTITPDMVTRGHHVWLNIRTEVRPENGAGFYDAHRHQDAYVVRASSAKPYVSKGFDPESLAATRMELLLLSSTVDTWEAFGTAETVKPGPFLIASAGGWAGLPKEHAIYYPKIVPPATAAALEPSAITVKLPPLRYDEGGFFSVTTYGPDAFIATEDYALNHRTASANDDGTYTFHFNAPGMPNNMSTVTGWNMVLRMYLPETFEAVMEYLDELERNNISIKPIG
ncbi:DUF1254 domain-containing protein [Corynebacterium alimapuense]|uniref:Lytic murein transglycosylase n=1 Tax=Corynebacterium alimapuense TaxID=1576874 RepID=A0A3M8K5R2_9CORY|nr:DUF1254 domain-containing protein [Corynebacterium alimapuense]RNE48516.1 lytic murein transglycosylase [Corynebacterium alimapuense]